MVCLSEKVLHAKFTFNCYCPVGWWEGGCRIPPPNECPGYDTKHSDGEVPVILELWRMWSTPSLPLLPGPLWLRVVALDSILSMGQVELNCVG